MILNLRAPPATFPSGDGKIQKISLPEDVYIKKFFQKHPDSKHQDAIKYAFLFNSISILCLVIVVTLQDLLFSVLGFCACMCLVICVKCYEYLHVRIVTILMGYLCIYMCV